MPDDARLIEKYEDEFTTLISNMRKADIRLEVIIWLLEQLKGNLEMALYADAWLSSNAPEKP
jgi:hypothetical protein